MAPNDEDMIDVMDELEEILGEYDDEFASTTNKNKSNDESIRGPADSVTDNPPLDLGIDNDVKTKKVRKLAPKLDETL
jgi:hypothetical protein